MQIHSVSAMRQLLDPKGLGPDTMRAAAQAQTLRAVMLETGVRHNQVTSDTVSITSVRSRTNPTQTSLTCSVIQGGQK